MTVDDIALTLINGLGCIGSAHLLEKFGNAENVFSQTPAALMNTGELREDIANSIAAKSSYRAAEAELRYMKKYGITALASTDDDFPALLRECPDYPHVIYVRGNTEALSSGRMLSMVGTRSMTSYGQRMCDELISGLSEAQSDTVIVSGMAHGIDGECHRKAVEYGLRTIAILANVLPDICPSLHTSLADSIIEKGGAVVSELHSGTKQNGKYYVPRNRIIAGVSAGTVVIESDNNKGAMHTAKYADSYDRVVMAVPGRATDKTSFGTNLLIRHKRASMVCTAQDILYELGWNIDIPGKIPVRKEDKVPLSEDERMILRHIPEGGRISIDDICEASGMQIGEASLILMQLEFSRNVKKLPGNYYERW